MTSISNLVHRFSHLRKEELNPILRFLQKYNILISHDEHKIHHGINSSVKFGVINKYTNYIYDYFDIWKKIEKFFYTLFGLKPSKKGKVLDYYNLYDNNLKKIMKSKIPRILSIKEVNHYKNILDNNLKFV